jgi:phosphoribosyl-AMP cyclohydrolase
VQRVKAIYTDCDADVLLVQVEQVGAACHEGYRSCFFRQFEPPGRWKRIAEKVFDPQSVYKSG